MSKDLHNMDDIFNSAYRQFEETPSANVWEKINAGLDKKDAGSYKKRLIGWKRTAILLFLLLTGFILYESGILKKGSGHSNVNTIITKTDVPAVPAKKHETNQDHTLPGKKNNDRSNAINKEVSNKNEDNAGGIITQDATIPGNDAGKKTNGQKPAISNGKVKAARQNDQMEINITPSTPGKNIKGFQKYNEILLKEKKTIPVIEKNTTGEILAGLLNGIRQIQLAVTGDSLLSNSKKKSTGQKRRNPFSPFWMITAFASYERAGYRLDSDLPANINTIKHREQQEPSFSAGLLITRQLTKRFGVQSGLIYSHTAIGISPQKMYALQDPAGAISFKYITSSGYAYIKPGLGAPPAIGDSLNTTEGKHTLQFVSVPIVIKYTAINNKFSFIPGAGIEVNLLTSAKVETEIERPFSPEIVFINKLNGVKSLHWSFVADAEFRYQATKKLSLNLRPSFRHAMSPITENNVVETFPYSFGLGIGMTYKF
jgi:hypothetical protein